MRHSYIIFILVSLVLAACTQELHPNQEVTSTFDYSVTVGQVKTRASFNGNDLSLGNYVFETGDKLYVTGGEGNLYGELTLIEGNGAQEAIFSGTLHCINNFVPEGSTELSITLVGANAATNFYTISNERITSGPNYPEEIPYEETLDEYVRKYSHFTATGTYNVRHFTLTQQSVFLNFSLNLFKSKVSGPSATVQIKDSGSNVLRTVSGIPIGGNALIANFAFTTVFPASQSLADAQIWYPTASIHFLPDFDHELEIEPNHYYSVPRTSIDEFTIVAGEHGANIIFNYAFSASDKIQYSKNGGPWTDYLSSDGAVSLGPNGRIKWRGQRLSYKRTDNKPLFSTTSAVTICGDIMSLICDADYVRSYTVQDEAFFQAFKNCTTINVDENSPLILTAMNLGTSCYEEMFAGCTALTRTPQLPATTMKLACYRKMFEGCTSLSDVPSDLLPAMDLANGCYARMFWQCSSITTAPDLPATTVKPGCYFGMFRHCTKMNSLKCYFHFDALDEIGTGNAPTGHTVADGTDPTVSEMRNWTINNLWTVVNKWLNNTCTNNGGDKGTFMCPSDISNKYRTGSNDVGSVPTDYWNIIAL